MYRELVPTKPLRFAYDTWKEFRPFQGSLHGGMYIGALVWGYGGLFTILGLTSPMAADAGFLKAGIAMLGGKLAWRTGDALVNAARSFGRRERGEDVPTARYERNSDFGSIL